MDKVVRMVIALGLALLVFWAVKERNKKIACIAQHGVEHCK